jgi:hypothetical protein
MELDLVIQERGQQTEFAAKPQGNRLAEDKEITALRFGLPV